MLFSYSAFKAHSNKYENKISEKTKISKVYVMRCAIWYHLHNFKNIKNTYGEVLLLVKSQAFSLQLY